MLALPGCRYLGNTTRHHTSSREAAMATGTVETRAAIEAALDEFAAGLDGKRPEPEI